MTVALGHRFWGRLTCTYLAIVIGKRLFSLWSFQTSFFVSLRPTLLITVIFLCFFFFGAKTLILTWFSNHNLGSIEVKSCALRWDKLNSVCKNVHQIVSDEKFPWQSLTNGFEFFLTRVETLKDFVTISPAWYSGGFQSCGRCGEVERRQHLLIECFSQNAPGQSGWCVPWGEHVLCTCQPLLLWTRHVVTAEYVKCSGVNV